MRYSGGRYTVVAVRKTQMNPCLQAKISCRARAAWKASSAQFGKAVLIIASAGNISACASDGAGPDQQDAPVTPSNSTASASPSSVPVFPSATVSAASERVDCDLPLALSYCGGGTCHYDTASLEAGSDLALWSRESNALLPGVEARLVNVPATYHNVHNPEACPTEPELLINPTDVEQSLILKKLTGTHACGNEMPQFPYQELGTVDVPGAQREQLVACVRQWVTLLVADYNAAP